MRSYAKLDELYDRVDENVFRLRPISRRPRRKVLTRYGQAIIIAVLGASMGAALTYYYTFSQHSEDYHVTSHD